MIRAPPSPVTQACHLLATARLLPPLHIGQWPDTLLLPYGGAGVGGVVVGGGGILSGSLTVSVVSGMH